MRIPVALTIAAICLPSLSMFSLLVAACAAAVAELTPQRLYQTRLGDILSPADNFFIPLACGMVLSLLAPIVP